MLPLVLIIVQMQKFAFGSERASVVPAGARRTYVHCITYCAGCRLSIHSTGLQLARIVLEVMITAGKFLHWYFF